MVSLLGPAQSSNLKRIESLLNKTIQLKVGKFQNEFMKSSFLPIYEPKIVRISALLSVAQFRAEILTIFRSYFGRNDDFINSF